MIEVSQLISSKDGAFSRFYLPMGALIAGSGISPEGIPARLVKEAMSRLGQLDYLRGQILESEDVVGKLVGAIPWSPDMALTIRTAMFKCQLYAEAFYLFSFRIFDITRDVNQELFSKKKICLEPSGIRDVRNHLIIHPTRRRQPVLNRSYHVSMQDGRGVVLKSTRLTGEESEHEDAGFRANAAEFQGFIENWVVEVARRLGIERPMLA